MVQGINNRAKKIFPVLHGNNIFHFAACSFTAFGDMANGKLSAEESKAND